jgi:amino acid transporter
MMQWIVDFALSSLLILSFGVIYSLPVLFIRHKLSQNQRVRTVTIALMSLFTAILMLVTMVVIPSYTSAYFYFGVGTEPPPAQVQAVTNELWLRQITPPVIRKYCLTSDADACQIADELQAQDIALRSHDWGSYLSMWLIILGPALVTGFCVQRFTRDSRKQKA